MAKGRIRAQRTLEERARIARLYANPEVDLDGLKERFSIRSEALYDILTEFNVPRRQPKLQRRKRATTAVHSPAFQTRQSDAE